MSNTTFDIKCIRANPQAGICEIPSNGGGSSTCDCSQGTYTPNITIPVQMPPLMNAFTVVNTPAVGVWSRVNNRYQVTVIVNVNHTTISPDTSVGTLQISLPAMPGAIPPLGLANWSGSGADYAVPGVVYPQGGPLTIAEVTVKPFPGGTDVSGNLIANFTYEV